MAQITQQSKDLLAAAGRELYWPRVLFVEDLAVAFRSSMATARRRVARGDFGPSFRIGRRRAVLKDDLLLHLRAAARECALLRVVQGGEGQ